MEVRTTELALLFIHVFLFEILIVLNECKISVSSELDHDRIFPSCTVLKWKFLHWVNKSTVSE